MTVKDWLLEKAQTRLEVLYLLSIVAAAGFVIGAII